MKYFMIGSSSVETVILHEIDAATDEAALDIAEAWWREQLPLCIERYVLARALDLKTTPKIMALAEAMLSPDWGKD